MENYGWIDCASQHISGTGTLTETYFPGQEDITSSCSVLNSWHVLCGGNWILLYFPNSHPQHTHCSCLWISQPSWIGLGLCQTRFRSSPTPNTCKTGNENMFLEIRLSKYYWSTCPEWYLDILRSNAVCASLAAFAAWTKYKGEGADTMGELGQNRTDKHKSWGRSTGLNPLLSWTPRSAGKPRLRFKNSQHIFYS